jgi:hypothetical protein
MLTSRTMTVIPHFTPLKTWRPRGGSLSTEQSSYARTTRAYLYVLLLTFITALSLISIQPLDHLGEEFPEVADYLRTVTSAAAAPTTAGQAAPSSSQPSQYAEDRTSEQLTDSLMADAARIMRVAEAEGRDPEQELRRLVGNTVLQGVVAGYSMGEGESADDATDAEAKRQRRESGT